DAGDDTLVPVGITTDQRGTPFSRKFGAHVDIGAFEATPLIVDTLADENDGDYSPGDLSLREAIFFANATPGADTITFDSTVFATAKTILLGGTQLTLSDTSGSTTITGPVAGLTIDANNASRVLQVNAGVTASVSGLTFTKGSIGSGDGGGVSNLGTLSLTNCTISGNSAAVTSTHGGGGLFNSGTVTLTNCTLNGNTASIGGDGGGLLNSGTAALANCTISGNTAANFGRYGGGVFNKVAATLTLTNCTISGNSAPIAGSGGGVVNRGTATVTNTIVAGNTATTNADLSGSLTPGSTNNLIGGSPLLGPLENNGGPTQTMALLSGSPAINAGDDSLIAGITTDQRGNPFSRTFGSHVDIGAFEATQSLVVDTLVDVNDGDYSPGNLSLREAIALANATPGADTITFKPGLTGTITLSLGELAITDDVTITGPGANLLTIDANDNSRVFNVDDGTPTVKTVTIDGLTITRGNISTGSKAGGGIFNNENLTVRNSTLSGNTATGGVATGGGAIFSTGALTVQNSTITGNKTTATRAAGGAISVTGGTATIQNSIFTNNSSYYGGALSNRISTVMVTVTGSTFSGNSVTGTLSLGGAIFNARTMTVQNSTLSGNTATTQDGGGAITSVSTLTLLDSTIANNTTTGSAAVGGGLYVRGGTANVGNTIITGNTATNSGPDISGPIASQGHNLIGNTSGATGFVASDLQNVASGLDPAGLQNNGGPTQTIKLIAGSKAIDAGDDTLVPGSLTTDQRGTPFIRKVGTVDIGAFEASRPPTAAVTTPAPDINVATGGTTTNSVTITYTDAGSGVDTRTFGTGNITIDNGATVSSISISGNAVTYYITAPAATWAASTQGTYTISLASGAGAVKSLAGDLVISGTIDSFNVDTLAPTAALTTSASNINVATGGTSTNTVVITYSDVGLGIDSKTFGTDDITVDNGATVTGFSAAGNALTYTITAPAGTWAGSTQGEYTIALVAGSVRDIAGNGVAGNASINSFNVDTVQPTITSISPPVGSPLGGDTIQIRGTGFTTATAVAFGGTPAAFVVNSDTSITVTSPAGAVGIVDVTVTTTGGTSLITPADRFAYVVPTGTFAKVTSVISSITSGRYRVGGVIPVTVNFDQPVTLSGGNLIVLLDSGGSVSITPFSNATHATGTYTVAAGQNSQSLNSTGLVVAEGATLRDGSGNNVNLAIPTGHTLSSTSNLLVDTKRPTVTIEAPSATATTHGPITFTISYADTNFSTNTLTAADITLTKTGTANGTVTVTGGAGLSKTVTISNITGTGTLGISLAAGTGSDTAGNLTAAAGPSTTFGVSNETPTTTAAFAVGGADGTVRLLDDAGNLITTVMPIAGYPGLVSVALGDFNGDTVPDLVVAAANPAGVAGLSTTDAGKVFVYDGAALAQGALTLLRTFTPFANHAGPDGTTGAYTNGLNIAVGDVDGDTHADVIAGTRGKSASAGQAEFGRLVAINGVTGAVIGGVQTPFGAGYQKGVIVAAGNVDGLGGDEIAVTRGGPVANPNPAVQQIKVKVLQLKGTTLSELPLNADGTTAFAPFVGLTGAASGINRDGRVAFVDSNGDGKDELVFTALDPLTNTTNEQVRVGVYAIDPTASKGAATIASTGPDAGTYLTGTAVNDHAITHVAAVGTQENIALLTESASSGVVYLAPLTGAVQTGGFSLNVITGGITVDGI
ncbi:MAG: IPT/TIG domain-containing protein, partial [Planctomycetes bacterium]|nr:IPT/TIG domain-containing protein [Planctomycetota bacterium]